MSRQPASLLSDLVHQVNFVADEVEADTVSVPAVHAMPLDIDRLRFEPRVMQMRISFIIT